MHRVTLPGGECTLYHIYAYIITCLTNSSRFLSRCKQVMLFENILNYTKDMFHSESMTNIDLAVNKLLSRVYNLYNSIMRC